MRIRLAGGRVSPTGLTALARVSEQYGDGDLHLTGRANLQLRGLPSSDDALPADLVAAIEATGLLPSRSHELVRNIMTSPLTGMLCGRADLQPVTRELDRLLCADPALAALPGRFLFVLDDGRGDLADRDADLGAVALDDSNAQLRLGAHGWGPVVALDDLPLRLTQLALDFLQVRGEGAQAPWHVDELSVPLVAASSADSRTAVSSPPLPSGPVDGLEGVEHVPAPDGVLDGALVARLVDRAAGHELVVTPWRGVLVSGAAR